MSIDVHRCPHFPGLNRGLSISFHFHLSGGALLCHQRQEKPDAEEALKGAVEVLETEFLERAKMKSLTEPFSARWDLLDGI